MANLLSIPKPINFHLPSFYHSIPLYEDAMIPLTKGKDQIDAMFQEMGHVFTFHSVTGDFELILLHRHFDIGTNEILVEIMNQTQTLGVTIPWTLDDETSTLVPTSMKLIDKYHLVPNGTIIPRSWVLSPDNLDTLEPFEYKLIPLDFDNKKILNPTSEFAVEVLNILKKYEFEHIFGLGIVSDKSRFELKDAEERGSIIEYSEHHRHLHNFHPAGAKNELMNLGSGSTVSWKFHKDKESEGGHKGHSFFRVLCSRFTKH